MQPVREIFSRSGSKFRWTRSDKFDEILIPRYLMLPMEKGGWVFWTAGFQAFTVIGSIVDLDQLIA